MNQIIRNLLLASIVILSSCSKEDDLLTPVSNPTTTTQTNDTIINTVTGDDTTVVCPWNAEYSPDESLTTATNNGTLVLEGSKYAITYSSFYLRNKYPCCAIPVDTTVFDEWYNMGEAYFSNQGDGYIHSKTYPIDCEQPYWNVDWQNWPAETFLEQPIQNYTLEDNKILVQIHIVCFDGSIVDYPITFDIVSYTNNTLIIENRMVWFVEPVEGPLGNPGMDCVRTVRLELEKIN